MDIAGGILSERSSTGAIPEETGPSALRISGCSAGCNWHKKPTSRMFK